MEAEPISEQKLEWMELNLEWASRNREPQFVGKTVCDPWQCLSVLTN